MGLPRRSRRGVQARSVLPIAGLLFLLPAIGAKPSIRFQALRPTPTPLWGGLHTRTPMPEAAPLPDPIPGPIDGIFARIDPSPPQWWACRRCADYRSTGGTWHLQLDKGVLRILHDVTGWRNLASFSTAGDRMTIFNDPICPWETGVYEWTAGPEGVQFELLDDACAFGLRAENLAGRIWSSCAPPNARAAASEAWPTPSGCSPVPRPASPPSPPPADLEVVVYAGDARRRIPPPSMVVGANTDNLPAPSGVAASAAERVVRYGLNVILWPQGDWIEWTVENPAASAGVQFWGPAFMGPARLLVDGREVWRGVTADLGASLGQYGGYVEVRRLAEGPHRIRVEHLGTDARPVNILFLGLE